VTARWVSAADVSNEFATNLNNVGSGALPYDLFDFFGLEFIVFAVTTARFY